MSSDKVVLITGASSGIGAGIAAGIAAGPAAGPAAGAGGRVTSEPIQSAALALERVHHVERGDGLALGVFSVRDGITDNVLKEGLEDGASLLVHESADALHTTTSRQSADRGLGDSLDVITQNLAMTLCATFA